MHPLLTKSPPLWGPRKESCLSGRKSHTRNVVYALRRTGGSNPSLSANAVNQRFTALLVKNRDKIGTKTGQNVFQTLIKLNVSSVG